MIMAGKHCFPVAQVVRNLPAMQETRVQSLGWEDLLEKGMAIPFSILVWRIHGLQYSCLENPMDGGTCLVGYRPWGRKESDTTE